MSNSVLAATFSDFRLVKGRKVAQLVMEVSIEQAETALALFGMPLPDRERWVALAPLPENYGSLPEPSPPAEQSAPQRDTRPQNSRQLSEMERALQRAAILCTDEQFRWWFGAADEAEAVERMRAKIGGSRRLIATDRRAYEAFIQIETDFRAATGQMAERR